MAVVLPCPPGSRCNREYSPRGALIKNLCACTVTMALQWRERQSSGCKVRGEFEGLGAAVAPGAIKQEALVSWCSSCRKTCGVLFQLQA